MKTVTYVISISLEPSDATAALKLRAAVDDMCAADATLGVTIGPANEIGLQEQHELQLDIAVDILKRGKGLDFMIDAPQVAYRESITKKVDWDYAYKRQTRGTGEYASQDPVRTG